jgi:hypothetical protein
MMTMNIVVETEQVALSKAVLLLSITREVKVKEGSKKKSFVKEEMLGCILRKCRPLVLVTVNCMEDLF